MKGIISSRFTRRLVDIYKYIKKNIKNLGAVVLAFILILSVIITLPGCTQARDKTAKNIKAQSYITISLWYSDEAYSDYFNSVAKQINKVNELITIKPEYISDGDILEKIYESNKQGTSTADIYLMSSDDVQKAYYMGLMRENSQYEDIYNENIYGKAAIDACSFNGRLYGYPLSFNVSYMLYNKKYGPEQKYFTDIESFCENYEITDENSSVKNIINWDIGNGMLNYGFISSYVSFHELDNNNSGVGCLTKIAPASIKQSLQALYSYKEKLDIQKDATTVEDSQKELLDGNMIYTITDAAHFKEVLASDTDFGVSPVPALTKELSTNALSTTSMLIVNPQSQNAKVADDIAKCLTYDYADVFLELSAMMPARGNIKYKEHSDEVKKLYEIYSESQPKSGMISAYQAYVQFEIMLHKIWDGNDIEEAYELFDSTISKLQ